MILEQTRLNEEKCSWPGKTRCRTLGAAVLRLLADRSGLTGGLPRALARRGFVPPRSGPTLDHPAVLEPNRVHSRHRRLLVDNRIG